MRQAIVPFDVALRQVAPEELAAYLEMLDEKIGAENLTPDDLRSALGMNAIDPQVRE